MMKNLKIAICFLICSMSVSAQYPGYLQITLNKNVMHFNNGGTATTNGTCSLDSASNTIYIHSGAGYKSQSSVWDAVVGNWGKADGIGEMTTVNDSIYTICMDLTQTSSNYYSNPNTANADSGIMPPSSTLYNIGCVFRDQGPFPLNAQGQPVLNNNLKGAGPDIDARGQCSDIWLIGVNTGNVEVWEEAQIANIPAVTTQWVTGCATSGIHDLSKQLFNDIRVSPNPFKDKITIEFNMVPDVTKVQAQVYDVMGRKVADFSPGIVGGYNSFSWDGRDINGEEIPYGTYLLKVSNGGQTVTKKIIKQ